jgi:prevent-host-death family protein
MNTAIAIEPVTALKSKSAKLIRRAHETRQPIVITQQGKATAVLQDVESYEEQRRSLLLLKLLAKGDQELKAGHGVSHKKAKHHFQEKIEKLAHE